MILVRFTPLPSLAVSTMKSTVSQRFRIADTRAPGNPVVPAGVKSSDGPQDSLGNGSVHASFCHSPGWLAPRAALDRHGDAASLRRRRHGHGSLATREGDGAISGDSRRTRVRSAQEWPRDFLSMDSGCVSTLQELCNVSLTPVFQGHETRGFSWGQRESTSRLRPRIRSAATRQSALPRHIVAGAPIPEASRPAKRFPMGIRPTKPVV